MNEDSYHEIEKFFKELLGEDIAVYIDDSSYPTYIGVSIGDLYEKDLEALEAIPTFLRAGKWEVKIRSPSGTVYMVIEDGKVESVSVGMEEFIGDMPLVLHDKLGELLRVLDEKGTVDILEDLLHKLDKEEGMYSYRLESDELYFELSFPVSGNKLDLTNKFKILEEIMSRIFEYLQHLKKHDELVIAGIIAEKELQDILHIDVTPSKKGDIIPTYGCIRVLLRDVPFTDLEKVEYFHRCYMQQLSRLREEWLKEYSKIPEDKEYVCVEIEFRGVQHALYPRKELAVVVGLTYNIDENGVRLVAEGVRTEIVDPEKLTSNIGDGVGLVARKEVHVDYVYTGENVKYKDVRELVRDSIQYVLEGVRPIR